MYLDEIFLLKIYSNKFTFWLKANIYFAVVCKKLHLICFIGSGVIAFLKETKIVKLENLLIQKWVRN